MLERVALQQTRFRTPGVSPDARGVLLGQQGLVLFSSLERLVSFLRAYGDEGSLDELVSTLGMRQVVTPLHTHEIVLTVGAESSYRMDRIAGIAKLARGLVFTGTSRHYVKYRDSASPLGYDVQELLDEPTDLVLYHDTFRQGYRFEREIGLRELIYRLSPQRLPPAARDTPARLLMTAETGVGDALIGYLFRWQVDARAALAEWPSQSAFDDAPRRLHLFDTDAMPPRIVRLVSALPGVHVFEPLGERVAVELGYRHPISLESCASLFEGDALHLFRGDGKVLEVAPVPPFAPVRSLVRARLELADAAAPARGAPLDADLSLSLTLHLAPTEEPLRSVVATVVPSAQREWLARLLYTLPPRVLASLRIAIADDRFYLVDETGIEGVPLGAFYSQVAPRIFAPAGLALVPAVAPDVLADLVSDRGDGYVFFEPDAARPRVVPAAAFAPLSRRILRQVSAEPVSADRPEDDAAPLPLLAYGRAHRFPLFGVPGRDEAQPGEGDAGEEEASS